MEKRIVLLVLSLFLFFSIANVARAQEKARITSASLSGAEKMENRDARAKILKDYLSRYNSPLADYSETFVKQADENNLDWKLLVSISGVESTFAQQLPYNSYNAWGWGIYGNNILYFKSYDEAIKTISKSLREDYINQWGAKDVYQIGRIYASSPTWAQRVVGFMDKIDKFAQDNPKYHLSLSI